MSPRTSQTLLMRVRDIEDRIAWTEFVDRYAPLIFTWCRKLRLQESDAADVTQEVLYKLVKAMREFRYDSSRGTFRGWLKTVTSNAVRDLAQKWRQPGRGSGDSTVQQLVGTIQDPQALNELSGWIEESYQQELLVEAERRVQERVQPPTWRAYQLTAIQQVAAKDAAPQVNMSVSEVYVAKSRVIKMLRQEIQALEHED